MITDTITKQIAEAMKAKDGVRLSTLRMLSSALNYQRIAKQSKLSEEDELAVVKKEVKKRKDAIEYFRQAQGKMTSSSEEEIKLKKEKEEKELSILQEYLPEQVGDMELERIIDEAIKESGAGSMKDIGKVIGMVMAKVGSRAEGSRVSALVKGKLS